MFIGRPRAAQLRAAGWLGFGDCCGGGRVVGMKGFACGFSLFLMVDIGRSTLAVVVARCDTGGGSGGGGGVGGCWTCDLEASKELLHLLAMAAAPCLGRRAFDIDDPDGGIGLSRL